MTPIKKAEPCCTTSKGRVKTLHLGVTPNSQLLFLHHTTSAFTRTAKGRAPGQPGDVLQDKPRKGHSFEEHEEAHKHLHTCKMEIWCNLLRCLALVLHCHPFPLLKQMSFNFPLFPGIVCGQSSFKPVHANTLQISTSSLS